MNNILDTGINKCSSCGVCAIACPAKCITINLNDEGFYRPQVYESHCTQCGICKKVCYQYLETPEPFINYFYDKSVYGAWSKNEETLKTTSSGGIGHELICHAINNGYKACGVIFETETDLCKHKIANTITDVVNFKSSKYLQSYTVEAFKKFKKDEKYLVIGTPCQIYGLYQWIKLKKWEDNFLLIDFFCHGTPSYLLWKKYKQHIQKKYRIADFNEVTFRSKEKSSWHSYAMKISDYSNKQYLQTKAFENDLFFKFFLSNTCLNESCYKCRLRLDHCASDIRLADFWGAKYADNEKGISLISINTQNGNALFENIKNNLNVDECSFSDLQNSQPTRFLSIDEQKRNKVIGYLYKKGTLGLIYRKTIAPDYFTQLKRLAVKVKYLFFD